MGVERLLRIFNFGRFPLLKDNAILICKPTTGLTEAEIEMPHHEIYRPPAGPADKASEAIPTHRKRQTRVMIIVKRAEALVPRYL